jgi:glutaredoxin
MKPLGLLFAVLLGVAPGLALAQSTMYRVVGADGRVTYTNEKPPAGAKATVVQPRVSSYSGAPVVSGTAPASAAPAAARPEVKMYATDWCGYCRQARQYFAQHGIRYTEVDIEKSAAGRAEYDRLGVRGVPVILVGAQRMVGFSAQSMGGLLKSAGY